ncbi:hypothetical protein ES702_02234 [subsurface metagenome]
MSKICKELHKLFNSLKRFTFPFDDSQIYLNGIYILFENGEAGHSLDRIVRIGTHTGDCQLRSRLKQHFILENKDRSIFRKNIGRAILNKRKDPYLETWELDLTTKNNREKFVFLVNKEYQSQIEKEVSKYIQENFSFCVFKVNDKNKRSILESKLISTVSLCNNCGPSKNWLGRYSIKDKIRISGLWQVNELYKIPISRKDYKELIFLTKE